MFGYLYALYIENYWGAVVPGQVPAAVNFMIEWSYS